MRLIVINQFDCTNMYLIVFQYGLCNGPVIFEIFVDIIFLSFTVCIFV